MSAFRPSLALAGRPAAAAMGAASTGGLLGVGAPGPARLSPVGHGLAPATHRFLSDLRLALSVADEHPGSGRPPDARSSFAAGSAPEDLDRIAALVELAQKGDAEAFGMLYERYVDTVYRYVYLRVGSKQTAEDLTAETFIRALRRIETFSWQGRDIVAWFITIARNLITDNAKSSRFRLEVTTADMFDADVTVDSPDTEVLDRMRDTRLVAAVRTLKPEQSECVVLRFFQGLSLAECAEVLGKSEGAVKQLQLRAVRALRRELGDEAL